MAENGVGDPSSALNETINRQGWLSKRGRLSKRWERRCCCLKKNELHYGLSAEKLNKVIPLEGCELSDCVQDKKEFVFKIKPRGSQRVYFFSADSEQERQDWLQAICFAKASGNMNDGSQACSIQ